MICVCMFVTPLPGRQRLADPWACWSASLDKSSASSSVRLASQIVQKTKKDSWCQPWPLHTHTWVHTLTCESMHLCVTHTHDTSHNPSRVRVGVCMCMHAHVILGHTYEGQMITTCVNWFFLFTTLILDQGHQAWWQVSFSTEPCCYPWKTVLEIAQFGKFFVTTVGSYSFPWTSWIFLIFKTFPQRSICERRGPHLGTIGRW